MSQCHNHCCHDIRIILMTMDMTSWKWLRCNKNFDFVMTMIMSSWHCNNDYDIMILWQQWLWCHDSNNYDIMTAMNMTIIKSKSSRDTLLRKRSLMMVTSSREPGKVFLKLEQHSRMLWQVICHLRDQKVTQMEIHYKRKWHPYNMSNYQDNSQHN